jgi:hypothetical protein
MRAPRLLALLAAAWLLAAACGCDASASLPAIDAGALVASTFACTVPASAPSKGSCVTIPDAGVVTNDGGVFCNPVTNEPCPSGQTCDTTSDANGNLNGLACYPGNNVAKLCDLCSNAEGQLCAAGLTCADVGAALTACARFCCSDADCGSGRCAQADAEGNALFAGLAAGLGECAAK